MPSVIEPLGSIELDADSTPASAPSAIYVATAPTLLSVIVTNTLGSGAQAYVYVSGTGLTDPARILHGLFLAGNNTYETFRFAVGTGQTLYVAGTTGLSFFVQGIVQEVA